MRISRGLLYVVVKPLCGFEEPDELDTVEELPSSLSGGMSSTEESEPLSDCTLTSLLFLTGNKRSVIDHNTHMDQSAELYRY